MKDNKNIVIFIDWFTPAFKAGGPIRSIENLVQTLGKELNFYLVTSLYDVDGKQELDVESKNAWISKENYHILYLDNEHQNRDFVLNQLSHIDFETVYFNSLFSKKFSIEPLSYLSGLNKKTILAPRGMLGKGALRIKPIKKLAFLLFAKTRNRYKKLLWHASSELEKTEIEDHFGANVKVQVALNLFTIPNESTHEVPKSKGELNLFFYSRMSKKKNLHFALRCLKNLDHLPGITFNIIGPVEEEGYWGSCQEFYRNFENIKVVHHGAVDHVGLKEITQNNHLFFFPTLHENFGHVIAESLGLGKPVLVSNNTPWVGLEAAQAGWSYSLESMEPFQKAIKHAYNMDQSEYSKLQQNTTVYLKHFHAKYCSKNNYIKLLT